MSDKEDKPIGTNERSIKKGVNVKPIQRENPADRPKPTATPTQSWLRGRVF
jgi:hypothetical protein